MIRLLGMVAACGLLIGLAAPVKAADKGQVAKSTLSELGLGSMQTMTDVQGDKVRGKFLYSLDYISYLRSFYPTNSAVGDYLSISLINIDLYYARLFPGTIYASPTNSYIKSPITGH
ncbi:MAG TPA: hypothetical protein VFE24_13455 [Pirellulales bacterium]|nr:hypothetical protein [Pirellulales bacterium]